MCHPAPASLEPVNRIQDHPRSNHFQSLMAINFADLWSIDPKFSALKDLNPFKTMSKVQEANITLWVGFVLLKWPYFNSIYLARVPFLTGIAVHVTLFLIRKKRLLKEAHILVSMRTKKIFHKRMWIKTKDAYFYQS